MLLSGPAHMAAPRGLLHGVRYRPILPRALRCAPTPTLPHLAQVVRRGEAAQAEGGEAALLQKRFVGAGENAFLGADRVIAPAFHS